MTFRTLGIYSLDKNGARSHPRAVRAVATGSSRAGRLPVGSPVVESITTAGTLGGRPLLKPERNPLAE